MCVRRAWLRIKAWSRGHRSRGGTTAATPPPIATPKCEMGSSRTVTAASLFIFGATVGIYVFWRACRNFWKIIPQFRNHDEMKTVEWESVGKVVKIFVYPVKSCKAISVKSADADFCGLVYKGVRDRSFIITSDKGTVITGRMVPSTVLIEGTFENNILTLNFPGSEKLLVNICQVEGNGELLKTDIWGQEVSGLNCGNDVSLWLEKCLHRKCKLLYHADLPVTRVSEHPLRQQFPLLRGDDHSLYADFTAYMLMTTESIADLQRQVNSRIAAEDFRPNILVEGTKKPYDEDKWQCIKIGEAVFRNVMPCTRCVFTTVSAKTGKKNPSLEPLRTLKKYRCGEGIKDPFFGINLVLYLAGRMSVGDEVFVTRDHINKEERVSEAVCGISV